MKKILSLILAMVMLLSFTACGDNADANNDNKGNNNVNNAENASDKVYKVGICQLVQHPALDAATQGFKDALTEKLGDNVKFDEQNASGEATNCTTITSKFVSDKVDLIMANATDALAAASQATADIPVVATSITDYATALGIEDWNGKTGFNVTGTADLAPLADQAAMIKELVPEAKNVAIIYCSAEKNSKYQSDVISAELEALGITAKAYTFVDTNDVTAVAQQIVADAPDAIFVPTDNTCASNTEALNNVFEPAKIPVIAGEEGICTGCGIATLSISYYDIGYKAGEMAYDILVNGKNPGDMDIEYAKDLTKKCMTDRAAAIGVSIPEGYEPIA